jgi:signal peptidase I
MGRFAQILVVAFISAVGIAVTIAVSVVIFLVRHFSYPSAAMLPTIAVGDRVLVIKRYPSPERGDLVAFSFPAEPNGIFIFRLIGMPGERIQMVDGHLHINGQPVKRTQVEDFVYQGKPAKQWSETLPNGVTHRTIDIIDKGFSDYTPVYIVPEGHYFMMGDNRDNSSDSRIKQRGTVPSENLIGRVFFCLRGTCR